jgi:hypothetical protein
MFVFSYLVMIAGFVATVVSVIYKDTSKDNKPTRAGRMLIVFALLILVSQIVLKIKEDKDNDALANAYEEAFTGWVSIGKFDGTKWIPSNKDGISPYFMGLKNKEYLTGQSSEQIKEQLLNKKFYMTSDQIYGHKDSPNCKNVDEWFNEGKNKPDNILTIFDSRQMIRILEIMPCEEQGQPTRFFAKVTDARNPL